MPRISFFFVVFFAGLTALPASKADTDTAALLDAALAGAHRSEANRARDRHRHPKETLLFFGLRPDMTVIELWPGAGGWYTEVLAPVLRERGRLIAAHFSPDAPGEYYRRNHPLYLEKLKANPAIYDRVAVIAFQPPEQVTLGPDGSADMVLTFRNLHNWMMNDSLDEVFAAAYRVLKPGGVFGVVEHRANEGTDPREIAKTGYVPESYVIELARQAGFILDAKSEINANPKDTKDHPKGVWTLPPTLRLGDTDRDKYLAIGESDRMTLRFVKPAAGHR
ncbi:MAG TPA: methyltransferase domain-containing protein [Gammaproteobacteria bacterium]|nr:methyltransferase domain-containing protein [Gammaproteobacteria bacterium]